MMEKGGIKMEKIHEAYGRDIWIHILQVMLNYCPMDVKSESFTPFTKATELFSPQKEEDRRRFGKAMLDLHEWVNEVHGLQLTVSYQPKSEFFHFPTLQSIWLYFIEKLYQEHDQKWKNIQKQTQGKVVPLFKKFTVR